ncbi:LysR family transcriptional regulator [Lampropedia puyangensis]|uniref:LysR family transcriptional regulator n=1 Tax=Lampropedia puyangensis TaxID=1330072 RepID=A0A4S8FDW2_9BURK|nr:LysR family transcriptional regulator [Lampropedia puyangensis]THU05291.1 LysR family transcriptional regulator [Lampropedia puyangensis]
MNIQPRHLRIFVALAHSLNFSRTADQFFITQPSLSKAVKDFEDILGVALFERSTRTVRLTHSGAELLPLATQLLGELDGGLQQLQQLAGSVSRKLSIAALPSLASTLLPVPVLHLQRQPQNPVAIRIYDGSDSASVQRLLRYQVDFALASSHAIGQELRYEELLRDRFVVVGAKSWHAALARPLSLDALAKLPVITMTDQSSSAKYLMAAYLQKGKVFQPLLQLDQVGTICSFVEQGVGVAVLPYLGAIPLLAVKGLRCQDIVDGPVRSIGIVTRDSAKLSVLAEQALNLVTDAAQKLANQRPEWLVTSRSK